MATITVRSLTGGNSNHPEPVFTSNALATDLVSAGVIGAITLNTGSGGTGAFAVNAQSSPNMSVRVNGPAVAYVTATPTGSVSQLLRVDMNTFQDVTISANASGSTKYDWIYIKIDPDLALNPDTSATTVGTIVTSRSSSNSSDNGTPPTYGYNLGYVTVANGASSITNSNITDSRKQTGVNQLADAVTLPTTTVVSNKSASNPYKFMAYLTAGTTSNAPVAFNATLFDTGSNFNTSTHAFVAPVAGFYWFAAHLYYSSPTNGAGLNALILKNGTTALNGTAFIVGAATTNWGATVSGMIQLAAGDTVAAEQSYTPTQTTQGGLPSANGSYFTGFLVSAT